MYGQPQEPSDLTSGPAPTLPSLVRSQLKRRRRASRSEVREALYGKAYYDSTHRRVYTELEGHHAA
jgi:hypothetical protein